MVYLSHFEFPTAEMEYDFMFRQKRTCYDTYYPFQILSKHQFRMIDFEPVTILYGGNGSGKTTALSKHQFRMIDFEPVTILYGGNGSGKTTALNVIAEKLGLCRDSLYNRSNFFEDYIAMCEYEAEKKIPLHSAIITSDDVFDFMLNLRSMILYIIVRISLKIILPCVSMRQRKRYHCTVRLLQVTMCLILCSICEVSMKALTGSEKNCWKSIWIRSTGSFRCVHWRIMNS